MIRNKLYKEALTRVVPNIFIDNGSILVTGASGLIGSCIIDLLMLANEKGRKFDIYALGRNAEKLKLRFSAFAESSNLHFMEQNVCSTINDCYEFDYIIHGASNADPRNYAIYPVETILINIKGAENVLEYCKNHSNTKAIMLSSFEVYGNAGKDVYAETDSGVIDLNQLRSCYPESKRCTEILTRCYVDEYKVNAVIGRLCSIYGPTMAKDDSKAHAQFIRNALKSEDIALKSKGEQRRTYCYVIDAVMGILCVLAKGESGEAYNISYEGSIASIADVAQTAAKIAGTKVVFSLPDNIERKGFSKPQNCILDNSKLKSLGWSGHYTLEEGLKETIKVLKDIMIRE